VLKRLSEGTHVIAVSAAGYEDASYVTTIEVGGVQQLTTSLKKTVVEVKLDADPSAIKVENVHAGSAITAELELEAIGGAVKETSLTPADAIANWITPPQNYVSEMPAG